MIYLKIRANCMHLGFLKILIFSDFSHIFTKVKQRYS